MGSSRRLAAFVVASAALHLLVLLGVDWLDWSVPVTPEPLVVRVVPLAPPAGQSPSAPPRAAPRPPAEQLQQPREAQRPPETPARTEAETPARPPEPPRVARQELPP